MNRPPVVVVGAGLAGLTCARQLHRAGQDVLVLEASDGIGGRVRTDEKDGFLLDRGFQVLHTAYPEAKRQLDYTALDLRAFEPGALVRLSHGFDRFSDPLRRPGTTLSTALSSVGTLADKLRLARFRRSVLQASGSDLLRREETTARRALAARGFSRRIVDRFFEPFFGGVFLDPTLSASSRWLELMFRQFSLGEATVPAGGMQEIPRQIAEGLDPRQIECNRPVTAVSARQVQTDAGPIPASAVVVATEQRAAERLLARLEHGSTRPSSGTDSRESSRSKPISPGVTTLYYAARSAPIRRPELVLNGCRRHDLEIWGRSTINSVCVPSLLSERYAPPDRHLVSVTVLDPPSDFESGEPTGPAGHEVLVRAQLEEWFGPEASSWRLLQEQRTEHALPARTPGRLSHALPPRVGELFVAGDHRETPSINGALVSGRKTAEAVLRTVSSDERSAA